jgi:hypothetical protein
MVCLRGTKIQSVRLDEVVGAQNLVDPQGDKVRAARAIGITFGDQL